MGFIGNTQRDVLKNTLALMVDTYDYKNIIIRINDCIKDIKCRILTEIKQIILPNNVLVYNQLNVNLYTENWAQSTATYAHMGLPKDLKMTQKFLRLWDWRPRTSAPRPPG